MPNKYLWLSSRSFANINAKFPINVKNSTWRTILFNSILKYLLYLMIVK